MRLRRDGLRRDWVCRNVRAKSPCGASLRSVIKAVRDTLFDNVKAKPAYQLGSGSFMLGCCSGDLDDLFPHWNSNPNFCIYT